jgi:hypothetical protein
MEFRFEKGQSYGSARTLRRGGAMALPVRESLSVPRPRSPRSVCRHGVREERVQQAPKESRPRVLTVDR